MVFYFSELFLIGWWAYNSIFIYIRSLQIAFLLNFLLLNIIKNNNLNMTFYLT